MKRAISLCTVLLVCGLAGVAGAASDTYLPSNQPLIKGTVTSTTDHSITVDSFSGERMTFTVDSRTVVPVNLAPGTRVKVEFHAMEDGRYHAARVTPFEPNAEEVASIRPVVTEVEDETTYGDEPVASRTDVDRTDRTYTTYGTGGRGDDVDQTTGTVEENRITSPTTDADDQTNVNGTVSTTDDDLPRTAGERNALWMVGLAALAAAGGMWLLRRRRTA